MKQKQVTIKEYTQLKRELLIWKTEMKKYLRACTER